MEEPLEGPVLSGLEVTKFVIILGCVAKGLTFFINAGNGLYRHIITDKKGGQVGEPIITARPFPYSIDAEGKLF